MMSCRKQMSMCSQLRNTLTVDQGWKTLGFLETLLGFQGCLKTFFDLVYTEKIIRLVPKFRPRKNIL